MSPSYTYLQVGQKWSYYWTKKDSISLAIYAAEQVLPIFKKEYPDDKRPRLAIEAARRVLKNDTKKNREAAAWAAKAAWAAARARMNRKLLNKCHKFVIKKLV